ncbi:hypothetical protein ABPG74_000914 [Tetrahymena malaccensis]
MCDTNLMSRDPSQSCASSSTIYPPSLQESGFWNESYPEINYDERQVKYQPNQQQFYTQQTQLCLQQDYQEDTWNVDDLLDFNNTPKNNQIQTTQQQFSNNSTYDQTNNTEVFYNNNYFDASRNQYNQNNKNQQQNHINNANNSNQNNIKQFYSYQQNGTLVYKINQPESMKYEDAQSSENYMMNYNNNQNQNQQIKQSCQFNDQQFKNQLFNQQNQLNHQNYQFYTQQPNNQQFNQYSNNNVNNQQFFYTNQQNYQQTNSLYNQQIQSPIYNQNLHQNQYNPQQMSQQHQQQQQLDIHQQEKIKISNAQTTSQNLEINQLFKHSQPNISNVNIQNNDDSSRSQLIYAGQDQQKPQNALQDKINKSQTAYITPNQHQIREFQQESKEIYQKLNQKNQILPINKEISESTDSKSCSGTMMENTKESSETKSNLTQDSQVRQNIYKSIMNAFKIFLAQKQKIIELFVNQEQLKIDNKLKQLARFLKTHSFNHQVLKYIALHDTYSIIFSHFINKECEMWLQKSKIVKKDIAISILNYLKQCVIDKTNFEDFVCYKTSKKSKKQKEYNFEDE